VLAWRLERQFSKDELLELYLNKVYFGDGLYGAEAASLGFFGKHARDVDVAEAALWRASSNRPPRMRRRRISNARWRGAMWCCRRCAPPPPSTRPRTVRHCRAGRTWSTPCAPKKPSASTSKKEVRKQLVQRFGWERVYQGGLKVYTTIDLDMQKAAEAEVAKSLAEIEQRQLKRVKAAQPSTDPLQAALVAVDPTTGDVAGPGWRPKLRSQQLQSRDTGTASGWFGIQAVRLRRGAGTGVHPGNRDFGPRQSDCHAAGRLGAR
jgi:penicillin-binding protein 1A